MSVTRPRLRSLDLFPAELNGQEVIGLRDPSGLSDHVAFVPRHAALVLALCDGLRTVAEIALEFRSRTRARIEESQINELLTELDKNLFLDNPRFHTRKQEVVRAFVERSTRPAAHAGASYPNSAAALRDMLDDALGPTNGHPPRLPIGLLAPHIDFARGLSVYADAYRTLQRATDRPELIVVFGTDHNGLQPFALTKKSYETPLGLVPTDETVVDQLATALDRDSLFGDEFHHCGEHSIEFQGVWLRHIYGDNCPPVVPILCGSFAREVAKQESPLENPIVRTFLHTLREVTATKRVLYVAAGDLAHVGPRFGDEPFGEPDQRELEVADRAALEHLSKPNGDLFFQGFVDNQDCYRVCGLSPIFATLAATRGRATHGELLSYMQCPADDAEASFVSIAALALY